MNIRPRFNPATLMHRHRIPVIDRFVCILADTEEARRLHHQVRFRVFCEETGFENPKNFPNRTEHDRYDPHARHFIIWDRQRRQCAGAMRLVDAAKTTLPCQDYAGAPPDQLDAHRHESVEFSRLCILNDYRRTTEDDCFDDYLPQGGPAGERVPVLFRQYDNDVFLRLVRASFAWSPEVRYCYFIATAALARVVLRFGIPLTQVGQPLEHRGIRIPFRYEVTAAEAGMRETLPGFAALVRTGPHYVTASNFFSGRVDTETLGTRLGLRDLPINSSAPVPYDWTSALRVGGPQPQVS